MLYRKLGNTGEKVSILGFGCMRFPITNVNDGSKIDKKQTFELLNHSVENGINYFDTSFVYHNKVLFSKDGGTSETVLGEFFSQNYREDVLIADKLPVWNIKEEEDFNKYLNLQLKKLKTDYVDVFLIHSLNKVHWPKMYELNVLNFLDEIKSDGRAKYVGFSFHDDLSILYPIIKSYNWDIIQTQLNYLDESYQAGVEGLKYINSKNIGTVIMEPLKGGKLVNNVPLKVQDIFQKSEINRTFAWWAFKYLYNKTEVNTVLSGMSSLKELEENISIASKSRPNTLSSNEKEIIQEVKEIYESMRGIECGNCKYCMPCPYGVDIPKCFVWYNYLLMLSIDDKEEAKNHYLEFVEPKNRASNCTQCQKCIQLCPQDINIPHELETIKNTFESTT
ncbi:MAG: aldo/keto reductase [Methanobrevibacter sp.]|jgi:predicted aldo/keto reductase-like oxidoreductase|nr:aldo/keto reductase [Methanobrevibacter sp.]